MFTPRSDKTTALPADLVFGRVCWVAWKAWVLTLCIWPAIRPDRSAMAYADDFPAGVVLTVAVQSAERGELADGVAAFRKLVMETSPEGRSAIAVTRASRTSFTLMVMCASAFSS